MAKLWGRAAERLVCPAMRLLLASVLLLGLASAAHAELPPAPSHFVRTWDFGPDGDGEDGCTIRLRADVVIGGYGATPRRSCKAVPRAADVYSWRPDGKGGVVFRDAERHALFHFDPDENYEPRGWGYWLNDAKGALWILNVHGTPPAPLRRGR